MTIQKIGPKIGVTGANGQLGLELRRLLNGTDTVFTDAADLDITDPAACQRWVESNQLTTILNAAAYTDVEGAEDHPELAFAVNRDGPANLARAIAGAGGQLVHVSTDYVFDGTKTTPYTETDPTNPLSVYGTSKLAGEHAVLAHAPTVAIIRTSWVYSPHGKNFVKTMLRLGREKPDLNVVADQVGTPTHAGHLAETLLKVAAQLPAGQQQTYHFSDDGPCSWADFATEIMRLANLPCRVNPVPTSAYPTKARRPAYGVLDKSRLKADFGIEPVPWQKDLAACIAQI